MSKPRSWEVEQKTRGQMLVDLARDRVVEQVRRELDQRDATIMSLVAEVNALKESLREAGAQLAGGPPWRAGLREVRYVTPEWAVRSLVATLRHWVWPGARILAAGAGGAVIMRVLAEEWPNVEGCDIEPPPGNPGGVHVADFLSREWSHDAIVLDPPLNAAQAFVEHALAQPARKVVALLPLDWLAAQERAAFWRENPADVLVLDRSIGGGPARCPAASYMWAIWGIWSTKGGRILRDRTWKQENGR